MSKEKIKVGQVWKQENNEVFVVTSANDKFVFMVYADGWTWSYMHEENKTFIFNKLIAEYPTWQEAVNSKEFNGGKE